MPRRPLVQPAGVVVQEDLLDAVVKDLNRTYIQRGLETAQEMVGILVDGFWGGSLERALRSYDRHATFRALRDRGDLQVGYGTLVRMLRVVALLNELEARSPRKMELSFSHLAELLSLQRPERLLDLAHSAQAEGWSTRQLRDAVAEANGEVKVPAGPLRRLHTGLQRMGKVVDTALAEAAALVDDPGEKAVAADVIDELDQVAARIAELRAVLVKGARRPH